MKEEVVLKVNNLSKQYRLGQVGTGTLSHDLNRWWHKIRGKDDPYAKIGQSNDRSKKAESEYVWALEDINFKVKKGDVLGIVGANGAGKSTLLKLISQITSPTTGDIKAKGRIASLLEVGTGMNPEMTAKENIYLNGAILGMTKKEINSKFDEIVEFSGCAMYIDTPIKRFSSGMKVRLGFAVAAFLEPEILIVDEVLAVGDAEFQKKAIGKMKEVSAKGERTLLFVSHNMAAVKSLCTRAILLEQGKVIMDDTTDRVVSKYLGGSNDILNYRNTPIEIEGFIVNEVFISSLKKDVTEPILRNEEILITIVFENSLDNDSNIHFTLKFKGEDGNYFLTTGSGKYQNLIRKGKNRVSLSFPNEFFNEGTFFVDFLIVINGKAVVIENDFLSFLVNPEPRPLGTWMGKELGYILTNLEWKIT